PISSGLCPFHVLVNVGVSFRAAPHIFKVSLLGNGVLFRLRMWALLLCHAKTLLLTPLSFKARYQRNPNVTGTKVRSSPWVVNIREYRASPNTFRGLCPKGNSSPAPALNPIL